jgi:hypothetical protein
MRTKRTFLLCSGLLLAATAAVAGTGIGGVFNLGQVNGVNARTQLQGSTATQQLLVNNTSTSANSSAIQGGSSGGTGVTGVSGTFVGVRGRVNATTGVNYGVFGSTASRDGFAGFFRNLSTTTDPNEGAGIRALAAGASPSLIASDKAGGGEFAGPYGVIGVSSEVGSSGAGVAGIAGQSQIGVYGEADAGEVGIFGVVNGVGGLAVWAHGNARVSSNLTVVGTVTKGGGNFRIDHPLDPANKYLSHSFVESPDMMNIYNGNVVTGANGEAIVELPDYFEALNRDPRYQLTVIGSPATAYVAEKVSNNRFAIKTSEPGVEVSWQVTGIRQDAFARAHPVIVEEDKAVADIGRYLHPVELGMPTSLGINADTQTALAGPH